MKEKYVDYIFYIIGLLIIFIMLFLMIKLSNEFIEVIKSIPKYETHYIDLDGNEGIAEFCDTDMSCLVENERILVKEYWTVEIK